MMMMLTDSLSGDGLLKRMAIAITPPVKKAQAAL
jgi:hypothetical protein